jgi:2-polyprenyl-3-methyl-5-hydroxy-6-metoxy-1,4-benzoquinol methylase
MPKGGRPRIKVTRGGGRVRVLNARNGIDLERDYDRTYLPAKHYTRTVHRDYAAHFFRYGWAGRFVGNGTRVLDIGCGRDQTLAYVLGRPHMSWVPKIYVGVDINEIDVHYNFRWAHFLGEFNFVERYQEISKISKTFDVITCFEVIEHMNKRRGLRLLAAAESFMNSESRFLLSTPVYNKKAQAANHIYEWDFDELNAAIIQAGLRVESVHGTFASANKIRKACTEQERQLLDELGKFLSNEVLSNFLAPKYPMASSNCAWVLRKAR